MEKAMETPKKTSGRPRLPISDDDRIEKSRQYQREWKSKNPGRHYKNCIAWKASNWEKSKEIEDRTNEKATNVRRHKAVLKYANKRADSLGTALEKEVRHHVLKGRDLGWVVAWMDLPVSILRPVVERIRGRPSP